MFLDNYLGYVLIDLYFLAYPNKRLRILLFFLLPISKDIPNVEACFDIALKLNHFHYH